tara:strand:+ start:400 stop:1413 length:1014 start_codon:yes stop_codon:yes gene_type:complete
MYYYFYPTFIIISLLIIYTSRKYSFFLDKKTETHKEVLNPSKNYFLGGFLFLLFVSTILTISNNFVFIIFLSLIFLLGLLSDLKLIDDPKKRFVFQGLIIFLFVSILDVRILSTRLDIVDLYFENQYINYFFVTFCLMIFMNGSNFMDGLNTLLIIYIILILIVFLIFFKNTVPTINNFYELIFILLFILILNSFGIIILGDSGAYLISIFFGVHFIDFANQNYIISPYFIILLLWYPCFELLFSMTRRFISNSKTYNADASHLHQLLYIKIFKYNKLDFRINHFLASIIINSYNFGSFYLGANFFNNSKILLFITLFNILIYIFVYSSLKRKIIKY